MKTKNYIENHTIHAKIDSLGQLDQAEVDGGSLKHMKSVLYDVIECKGCVRRKVNK